MKLPAATVQPEAYRLYPSQSNLFDSKDAHPFIVECHFLLKVGYDEFQAYIFDNSNLVLIGTYAHIIRMERVD